AVVVEERGLLDLQEDDLGGGVGRERVVLGPGVPREDAAVRVRGDVVDVEVPVGGVVRVKGDAVHLAGPDLVPEVEEDVGRVDVRAVLEHADAHGELDAVDSVAPVARKDEAAGGFERGQGRERRYVLQGRRLGAHANGGSSKDEEEGVAEVDHGSEACRDRTYTGRIGRLSFMNTHRASGI